MGGDGRIGKGPFDLFDIKGRRAERIKAIYIIIQGQFFFLVKERQQIGFEMALKAAWLKRYLRLIPNMAIC